MHEEDPARGPDQPPESVTPTEPSTLTGPGAPTATSPMAPTAAPEAGVTAADVTVPPATPLTGTDALKADITAAWSKLDKPAKLLVNASAATFILILIGLPLSVWDSAPFALLILAACTFTIVTAWFGAQPAMRTMPIPVSTIELIATSVVVILAVMKAVEILFDLDSGVVIALVASVALGIASVVMAIAVIRRGADPRGAIARGDQGTKVAAVGLALVLLGWAFNLSISFWTMGQAALPLAVLAIAALTIAEAPRITSPVPVAWVGAGIAVFGAILVLAHWGDLTRLGGTQLVLDPSDFLGLVAYTAGTALIIAGGVLSGRAQWTPSHAPTDPPALDPPALG